jgi:hypothetical protein
MLEIQYHLFDEKEYCSIYQIAGMLDIPDQYVYKALTGIKVDKFRLNTFQRKVSMIPKTIAEKVVKKYRKNLPKKSIRVESPEILNKIFKEVTQPDVAFKPQSKKEVESLASRVTAVWHTTNVA